MHTSFLILELTLLTAGVVGLLTLVGLTPIALAVPDLGGAELLLCPFVGLAILYWTCQWLSPYFASGPIVVVTCVVTGLASLVVIWRKRALLVARLVRARVDLAILAVFGLAITIVLQLPLLQAGTFTLTASGGDDLFAWAPTAAFMQTHAYAAPHSVSSPLLWILPTNIYPGSAGTVDGGLMTIFHMQGYQFVEPFTAICLALGACAVYGLLRSGLRTSRWIAALGVLFVGIIEHRPDMMGLAQSVRGDALMLAAILLFLLAFRRKSTGLAVVAGGVAAVLVGVYMPVFLPTLAAIAGGTLVLAFPALRGRAREVPWRTFVAFAAGGLVFGIQNIRWLFFQGGLSAWEGQVHYGHIPVSEPFQTFVGTAPYNGTGVFLWGGVWNGLSIFVAILAVVLAVVGAVGLARRQRLAAGCLIAPLAYAAVILYTERGGFGAFVTMFYVTPIFCVVAAYGVDSALAFAAIRNQRRAAHGRSRFNPVTVATGALGAVVGVVVLFEVVATSNVYNYLLLQTPQLSPTNLHLSSIADVVPKGARILMYPVDGSTQQASYANTLNLADSATFLPDRAVSMTGGGYFSGIYDGADQTAITDGLAQGFPYVLQDENRGLGDPRVPATYHVIWTFPADNLVLYAKGSPGAATASLRAH